jgi:hypothetical protein
LQQGIPEVQKNLQNRKYVANEIIRMKNGPEKKLGAIQLRKFNELLVCQIRRCNYRFTSVCGTSEVHKQGTPEVLFTSQRCIAYVHGTPAV